MSEIAFVAALGTAVIALAAREIMGSIRAKRWERSLDRRLGELEQRVLAARRECERRQEQAAIRMTDIERRLACWDAPNPNETIMVEEEYRE